ncbi:hypothetical protein BLOT_000007 [Blomia tropicalis]|nr:hypothetical protein BLOT_000007 [Blomia tropicalis]
MAYRDSDSAYVWPGLYPEQVTSFKSSLVYTCILRNLILQTTKKCCTPHRNPLESNYNWIAD